MPATPIITTSATTPAVDTETDVEIPTFGAIDQTFIDRLTGRNALLEDYAAKLQVACQKLQAQVEALRARQG